MNVRRFAGWLTLTLVIGIGAFFLWAHWSPSPEDVLAELPVESGPASQSGQLGPSQAPILVLTYADADRPFSRYILEILASEGITSYDHRNIDDRPIAHGELSGYALVISAAGPALDRSVSTLERYVNEGGRLLVIDPSAALDSLLGVRSEDFDRPFRYVRLDADSAFSAGLSSRPLQIHGSARALHPATCRTLASLHPTRTGDSPYAGAGIRSYGSGYVAFLAYDLCTSTVIMRQGEPRGQVGTAVDWDEDGVTRTADLFYRTVDTANCFIPQGDEQHRFFVRLIDALLSEAGSPPRFWYFPDNASAIALVTGDAHNTAHDAVDSMIGYVERAGGSFTLIEYPTALEKPRTDSIVARGHNVLPHFYYPRLDNRFPMRLRLKIANWFSPTYFYEPRFADVADEIAFGLESYGTRIGLPVRATRMHFLIWWGWSETAELFARHGIRMDLSVTGLNPHRAFILPIGNGGLKSPAGFGYINGSGLPMRYVDEHGSVIDMFSQLTIVEDDVISGAFIREPVDSAATVNDIVATCKRLVDESVDDYHTALVFNFHPEHAVIPVPPNSPVTWPWVTATIDRLRERQVPMLPVHEWLRFSEARASARISAIRYDRSRGEGSFEVMSTRDIEGATILVPIRAQPKGATTVTAVSRANAAPIRLTCGRVTRDQREYLAIGFDLLPASGVRVTVAR